FGYYNQEQLKADDDQKVIDVIRDVAEFIPLEKGRQMSAAHFLEKFLFPRDMHYNFVSKLSGGEKRRLKLMTVLMKNPNFLILDEPTNDLDIFVMGVLEEYLRSFEGCLIVVSHDRYFMDKMVDHLFVFDGSGEIKDVIGNYSEYRKLQKSTLAAARQEKKQQELAEADIALKTEVEVKEKRKLTYKEQKEYESLEGEIEQLEARKEELTAILSSTDSSNEDIMKAGEELGKVVAELDDKTNRWLELSEFA